MNYNDGKIHGWNGGKCPVHEKTRVRFWFRSGGSAESIAGDIYWGHSVSFGDVIAFCVIKEYKESQEFWVNKYKTFHTCFTSKEDAERYAGDDRIECIHVKEVM